MIRVVLADDQRIVRAGFRALLELTNDLVVVGEAGDGREAVTCARRTRPVLAAKAVLTARWRSRDAAGSV